MTRNLTTILNVLLIPAMLACCTNVSTNEKPSTVKHPADGITYQKPRSSYNDTFVIEAPAAVFYYADSLQLKNMKDRTEPQSFEANMHEFEFLIKTAKKTIAANMPGLKITEANKKRYLLFLVSGKNHACVDLDTLRDPCGLVVCSRHKRPEVVDMANADSEIGFYFSK